MIPVTRIEGVAVPLDEKNVDTDQIVPARFLLKPRSQGYGEFLFHDLRFTNEGSIRKDFPLNLRPFHAARVLIANTNFGCGSAREHACYALVDYGIQAVVAPSFGDIFRRNCARNGVIAARIPGSVADEIRGILWNRPGVTVCVDARRGQVSLLRQTWTMELEEGARERLLEGLDDIDLTLRHAEELDAFEMHHQKRWPWVFKL